ncbi:tRNA pseudouridine(55) synthase TruB [Sphingomonas koreensis]|jgi:tRNA pseudouridine55 synthase|uniref:tRNA pseudouridine synthase B n=1 Tax=Sphingomonas koreensis TaxID=93064 RepID=A0A1L6J6Z5_9SPHN|nr:tRNA pseudouridine(55) synthase TruB [Sphingomonas koreensis]APR51607.1 tRNA pseudouridine(55) synthase TruB [Sphingomonas koreensis]MDC7811761.1 tRNA pseudouridine(55) synthase TruB [Sphingomonas koreensis]RSU18904.1 tRNA pseudouridine(55) synthase TruB [Sphingomonas koreensis]RSU19924.1 tRNA pseudouridine(55) synthase TruB [Sphingomonas koreensis]RSU21178.1 tRNA pseudouridine(55) synthase TruB [Sphingomonas koreensis]
MHGWIVIDKPLGLGSTQGVSAVKRALRDCGYGPKLRDLPKVGHGGTLDPLATGVLPIAVGEATKLAGRMLDSDKVYDFTIRFGEETDTLDLEGTVIAVSTVYPSLAQVEAVLPRFTGPIEQLPPNYSALKVDGERAYDLARKGESFELAPRAITIHALSVTGWTDSGAGDLMDVTLTAHVSKGTYIRSLARDIALALGTVGHVTMLRRFKAGPFTLESAISLDKLAEAAKGRTLEHCLLPLRAGLDDIPALTLEPGQAGALRQGKVLTGIAMEDGQYFALEGDTPVALVEVSDGIVRVVRGFNL